jgi:GNAT superfamily N-acetyltransferase
MPSPFQIRDYAAGDLPAVLTIIEAALVEHGFGTNVGGMRRDLETIEGRYDHKRAGFWVALSPGGSSGTSAEVIGVVAVRPKDDRTCELKRLYARPDFRGKGLGRALYEHAEAFARAAGYERIWLDSSRRFKEARKLYERSGFVLIEELDNDWEDNVYEKWL